MAGAIALGGVARTFLVNVAPHDPLVLGAICLVLALVGLLSALVPARRASRVDPVIALRAE
jgi:ABC-type antimicrobial peptide transport system permease subunit